MENRVLWDVHEGLELRIEAQPAARPEERQAARGLHALQQELLPFAGEALARKRVLRHRGADGDEIRRGREERHPREELHGAQDAERVLGEVIRDVAQDARAQVADAVPRIEDLERERVRHHRVDGKVASRGGLGGREPGIGGHREVAMSGAEAVLAARQGDVDVAVPELHDAERRADPVERPARRERGLEAIGRDAVDLQVEVVARAAEQRVADAAADEPRAPADRSDERCDLARDREVGTGVAPEREEGRVDFVHGEGRRAWHIGRRRVKPAVPFARITLEIRGAFRYS